MYQNSSPSETTWINPFCYKILSEETVPFLLARRIRCQPLVLAAGCFDLLHAGHIRLLLQIHYRFPGALTLIALWSDDRIRFKKGITRPYYSSAMRAEILSALDCVDFITVYDEETPEALIRSLHPDYYVKANNYTLDQLPEHAAVEECGGEVILLPAFSDWSTTGLVRKIRGKR